MGRRGSGSPPTAHSSPEGCSAASSVAWAAEWGRTSGGCSRCSCTCPRPPGSRVPRWWWWVPTGSPARSSPATRMVSTESWRCWQTDWRPSPGTRRRDVQLLPALPESSASRRVSGCARGVRPTCIRSMAADGSTPNLGRVLLVSSDPLVRAGLAGLLAASGTAVTVEAGALVDAVVWDTASAPPPALGPGATPVLALVRGEQDGRAALSRGAAGAVLRTADAETLRAALLAVVRGLV